MIKPGILFVDDEQHIIDGLKRMMHSYKNEWDLYFALSGADGLQLMESNQISVIITDMRMPNMNGAELLEIVQKKYPEVIRIILSGHSDEELILRSINNVHQFLAKPCNSEIIVNTIRKTFYLKNFLNSKALEKIINGIKELPSIPDLYLKIESELNSNSVSLNKVAELISHDLGISAKILQIVNSAFFGTPVRIANIDNAVNMLGINTIKSIILYLNFNDYYKSYTAFRPYLDKFWLHSFKVARNAQIISQKENNNPFFSKEAYAAGLLHDIGKFILLQYDGYASKILSNENVKITPLEYEMLGVSHSEVGAYLLALWNLPNQIIEAVAFHNKPHIHNDFNLSTAVYAANLLSHENYSERMEDLDKRIINRLPEWKELIFQNDIIIEK
jgi:HD-like signal output (HDOD) protein/CheY-like chemotaxis protein